VVKRQVDDNPGITSKFTWEPGSQFFYDRGAIGATVDVTVQNNALSHTFRVGTQGATATHKISKHATQHQAGIAMGETQMSQKIHACSLP